MFKILNYLNYAFVFILLLGLLTEYKDEGIYSLSVMTISFIAILQLFIGVIWLIAEPLNKRLISYFALAVLFAMILAMRFEISILLLPIIVIYFTVILHLKATKTKQL